MTELVRGTVPALRLRASRRAAVACAVLTVLAALVCWLLLAGGGSGSATTAGARPLPTSEDLPAGGAELASARIGAGDPAYNMDPSGSGLLARNPVQRLQARLGADGVLVAAGAAHVRLQPRALGYGDALRAVPAALPAASSNRALYARPGLSEWYANGPMGLEQGFIVPEPQGHAGDAPLTIAMSLSGNLEPTLARHGAGVLLTRAGRVRLAYGSLRASDASGRSLPAWLQLHGRELLLRVDTRGAAYPLRIDPVISTGGELTGGSEESEGGFFGQSVALSPDGNTLVVGAPRDGDFHGSVWIYTRTGEGWAQVGPKLVPPAGEEPGQGRFGQSVAISADGRTVLIGAVTNSIGVGAAWVYTLQGGEWVQQGPRLTGDDEVGKGYFGQSVALSADGGTAVIGGFGDNERAGAAWVFKRNEEGAWSQQGPKLTGAPGWFGTSVAISGDGGTVLVGDPHADGLVGAVYPFVLSEGTWTQGEPLTGGEEESGEGLFGQSVALSPDGSTALVGAPHDDGLDGAVWSFTRSGGGWSRVGSKLTGDHGSMFGYGVALSPDGGTALIGGPRDHHKVGAVWEFTGSGGDWTLTGRMLGTAEPAPDASEEWESGLGELEEEAFGRSVALSDEALVALIGAPRSLALSGSVWQFPTAPPSALTETPTLVKSTSVTLRGSVNPEGRVLTDCHFDYSAGTATASVPCASVPLPQTTPAPVSVHLTGLVAGVSYRFSLHAATASGPADGGSVAFTTLSEGTAPASVGGGGGGGQTVVLPFVASACPVTLASKAVMVRGKKKVQVKLLRSAGGAACSGKLKLVLRRRVKGHLRSTTIATGTFAFASAQHNLTALLPLTSFGRKMLAAKGKPSLVLTIAGVPASSASVHVTQPKPPKKHP